MDADGTATYSGLRSIPGRPQGAAFTLNVHPNPAHGTATLEASGPVPAGLRLQLCSADGRRMWASTWTGSQGITPLPFTGLAGGMYLLRYYAHDGSGGTIKVEVVPWPVRFHRPGQSAIPGSCASKDNDSKPQQKSSC